MFVVRFFNKKSVNRKHCRESNEKLRNDRECKWDNWKWPKPVLKRTGIFVNALKKTVKWLPKCFFCSAAA
jgi:hypothetical protein